MPKFTELFTGNVNYSFNSEVTLVSFKFLEIVHGTGSNDFLKNLSNSREEHALLDRSEVSEFGDAEDIKVRDVERSTH